MRKKKQSRARRKADKKSGKVIKKSKTKTTERERLGEKSFPDKEKIKKLRKETKKQMEILFSKLEQMLLEYNPIQTLTALSHILLLSKNSNMLKAKSGLDNFPDDEIAIEYLMSFILSLEYTSTQIEIPRDNVNIIKEIYQIIESIFHATKNYFFTEFAEDRYSPKEQEIRFRLIMKSMNLKGHYYLTHYYLFINEFVHLISSFNANEFGEKISFSLLDIWNFINQTTKNVLRKYLLETDIISLMNEMQDKYENYMLSFEQGNLELSDYLVEQFDIIGKTITDENEKIEKIRETIFEDIKNRNFDLYDKIIQNKKELGGNPEPILKFIIRPNSDLEKDMLKAISLKIGNNKDIFAPPNYAYNILNPTAIHYQPIIFNDKNYYCFHHLLPLRNLLSISENLIKINNKSYIKKFLKQRDKFTEKKTKELFQKLLQSDSSKTFNSLYYGDYELDIMIIQDRALFLIEVKAGMLPDSASRGSVKSYLSGMEELIGKAFEQAERALNYISTNSSAKFYEENRKTLIVEINSNDFDNIIPISVLLENIGDSITNLGLMNKLNLVSGYNFWAVNIFDLYVFADLIRYPSQLIHYLKRRFNFKGKEKLGHIDELEFLGLYLKNNGYLSEETEKEIDKMDTIFLDGFMEDIDAYFYAQDANLLLDKNEPLPKLPRQEMSKYFEYLLKILNKQKPDYFTVVSILLMDLDQEARELIHNKIEEWESDTEDHAFTIGVEKHFLTFYRSSEKNIEKLLDYYKPRLEELDMEKLYVIKWDNSIVDDKCKIIIGVVEK
ncbi:MAG: hypothetical protein OEY49_06130 [Candidatus Heimdallarchaeota archaeon]|nr:hypothetical protein [Candidatus Heimdallarchaeota archaeon]